MTDKEQRGTETNGPQHEKDTIADTTHIPKEERSLHETFHIRSLKVIEEAVPIHKQASRSTAKERPAISYDELSAIVYNFDYKRVEQKVKNDEYEYDNNCTSTTIHGFQQQAESRSKPRSQEQLPPEEQ